MPNDAEAEKEKKELQRLIVELGIDEAKLLQLLHAADKLKPELLMAVENCRLFKPPLSYRGRIKRKADIVWKIRRKRSKEGPDFGLEKVRDVVGLRFVTLLRQDIPEVVENIFKILGPHTVIPTAGRFKEAKLVDFARHGLPLPAASDQELEANIDRLQASLEAVLAANRQAAGDVKKVENVRRAQYSSVHIHLQIPYELDGEGHVMVPVEIQVRSVFEDAWGEFDHMLFYEIDRTGPGDGKDGKSGRFDRDTASRQLRVLKSILDSAEEYAVVISGKTPLPPPDQSPNIKKDLDGIPYIRKLCEPFTEHRRLLDEFVGLSLEKAAVDDKATPSGDLSAYLALAARFGELYSRLADVKPPSRKPDQWTSILYMVQMEEAVCRFLSGDRMQMLQAAAAYRSMHGRYQRYPGCRFRLAQVCASLMEKSQEDAERDTFTTEALEEYRLARELLDAIPPGQDLLISPGQRTYLNAHIERLRGFVLWRRSDIRRKSDPRRLTDPDLPATTQDLDDMLRALSFVEPRVGDLDAPPATINAELLNNATYFAWEAHKMAEQLADQRPEIPPLEKIGRMVVALERASEAQKNEKVNLWQTIMIAYKDLGEASNAIRVAKKLILLLQTTDTATLGPYDLEVHGRTMSTVQKILEVLDP